MKGFWITILFGFVLVVNSQRFRRPPQPQRPVFQPPPFQPPPFQPLPAFRPSRPPGFDTLNLPDGAEFIIGNLRAGFSCEGRRYGYYADVANNCQVFHVCLPVTDENGFTNTLQWSFFCGNQTVFNQELMVCDHHTSVDCSQAESYYYRNDEFGIIPPKKFQ